ncbi:substrate-binding domain-containing protein [Streptomyces sp. NPDC005474]|uniref:substrate-binding domain-containing protein n=1 Tax=Streptomyces sp. NPDC005474 TaxID=3154878 RepID=UPI003455F6AD
MSPTSVPPSHVDADNIGGARSAVSYLLKQGRTAIATITGPLDMYVAQSRLHGYRNALEQAGLKSPRSMVAEGDFTEDSGRRAVTELLERHPEIDGLLAASDTTAAGALRAAGRRVPEDVAVIGFEDFPLAQRTEPPLTTVRQPLRERGRAMIRLLLEEMEEPVGACRRIILRTELVVCESA